MRRKKKDKNNINNQEEIDLIPIESQQEETEVGTQPDAEPENPEATAEDTSDASLETETEVESAEPESSEVAAEDTSAQPETPEEESESSALFGAYVAEENKWERKNRIKDEKIKAKQEKKRAKYADVDDDTYEQMKAGGAHKFFGVLSLMMLIVGIAAVALFVYRLVIAPSYAQVGEKEKLHVEGFATETDTSKYEQQVTALQGIATPSDLTDTWVEQPFEQATPSDVSAQDTEGADTLPADDAEAKPVVID
jgi:hypothetical protein